MADTTETTFRDLIVDNRYKEMERNVKLARLQQIRDGGQQMSGVHQWPSLSSIHLDSMDSSYTASSLRSFKAGSEIISSSTNMRNLHLRQQHTNGSSYSSIATSSVNKFPIDQKNLSDRDIMPPPSIPGISLRHVTKDQCDTDASGRSETRSSKSQASDDLSSVKSAETNGNTSRTFCKWKVMLNDQGQLIIKGILNGGRVVRSRPVVRRLTATSVESINRCTYHLEGNIVDERNELPDYVVGKFYNGFPNDWENVHQVWKNFMSQGCPVTFHWPTRITDSDDDITSEVTDITYKDTIITKPSCKLQSHEIQPIKFTNKSSNMTDKMIPMSPSKVNVDRHAMQHSVGEEMRDSSMSRKTHNYSLEEKMASLSPKSLKNLNQQCDISALQEENTVEYMSRDSLINNLKHILLELKWKTIINRISDKNCPPEYMSKVVQMYGNMRDIISYESVTEQALLGNTSNEASKCWLEDKSKSSHSHSQQNGSLSCDNNASRRNMEDQETQKEHSQCSSDHSESETYAGVPKISLERVLQAQELRKRSTRPKRPKPKRFREVDETKDKEDLKYDQNPPKCCESSVTISEEEIENDVNPRNPRNVLGKFHETPDDAIMRSATEEKEGLKYDQNPPKCCDSSVTISKEEIEHDLIPRNPRQVLGKFHETSSDVASMRNSTAKGYSAYQERTRNAGGRSRTYSDSSVSMTEDEKENDRGKRRERFHHQNEEPKSLHSKYLRESNKEETKSKERTSLGKHHGARISGMEDNSENYRISQKASPVYEKISHPNHRTLTTQKQPDETLVDSKIPPEKLSSRESTELKKPKIISMITYPPCQENLEGKERTREYAGEAKSECGTKDQQGNAKLDTKTLKLPKSKSPNEASTNASAETASKTAPGNKLGTMENPYSLTAWFPQVVSTNNKDASNDCRLVFEGKLVNEAGHIVQHRYTTEFVSRRVHSKLIETVNNMYYVLIGDVTDTKHVVPPELLKQCKNGCPAKIEQFCKAWKATSSDKMFTSGTQLNHDTSVDMLSVSTSSRGRRTVPPLRYWMGERIVVRDNTTIYSPLKSSQDSSFTSGFQSPENFYKSDTKPKSRSMSVKKSRIDLRNVPASPQVDKSLRKSTRPESSAEKPSEKNLRKVETKSNKRIAQQIHFSSDSSDNENDQQQQKSGSERNRKLQTRKKTPNSSPETEQKHPQLRRLRSNNENFKEPEPQSKSKKRQKIDDTYNINEQSRPSKLYATRQQPKSKSTNGLSYSFHRGVPTGDDVLSDLSQI